MYLFIVQKTGGWWIAAEKLVTLYGIVVIVLAILFHKDFIGIVKKLAGEYVGTTLSKSLMSSMEVILEVKNIKDLERIADNIFFLENPAAGKVEKEKKETWHDVKKEINFKLPPINFADEHKVFFITGNPGVGKSTYMLWSLDKFLERKSWWKPAKKKIVFLNPWAYDNWAEELAEYKPKKTLLVIDALWQQSDNNETFRNRCLHLLDLALGEMKTEDDTFEVLATIRKDEYEKLISQPRLASKIRYASLCKCEIKPEDLNIEKILQNYLDSYKISYETKDINKGIVNQLRTKSGGLPAYIRHLVIRLQETNKEFSKETLDEFPPGIANLIWDTITKLYYSETDIAIPFLLLFLSKRDKYFSSYFLDFVGKALSQENKKPEILERIANLRKTYFSEDYGGIVFAPNSFWKDSLCIGVEHPNEIYSEYRSAVSSYRGVLNEFNRLIGKIVEKLKNHLQEGFKDKEDIFLCVDLAQLKLPESEESLEIATDIYMEHSSSLSPDEKEYVQKELCKLWINSAWKYRTRHGYENDKRVITCYENAFDTLGVRNDARAIHAYAYFLQERILPRCNYGTQEWKERKKQIEKLYQEVIDIQLSQNVKKDPISYQALALFYADVEEEEKAEQTFKKAFDADPAHIPTMQAYAIFLKDRGEREYDRAKALDYYKRAERQFKKAIETLNGLKENFSKEEFGEFERKLLHACASFLIDETEWTQELDERKRIDAQVDRLFSEELLKKYPNHGHSVTAYCRFLMDFAWILDKYKCWEEGEKKNLRKARLLLEKFTSDEKKKPQQELSYFIALHILALYYYRRKYNPRKYTLEQYLQRLLKAEEYLKKSSMSFSDRHNSVAYNELGRLYIQWARVLKDNNQCDYEKKMSSARESYEEAIRVAPKNRQSFSHLSGVYFNYAFYFRRMNEPEQSEECIRKALEIVKGFVPTSSYYSLTNLGTEFLRDNDLDTAERIFIEAKNIQSEWINPSYALCKLGDINGKKGNIKEALKNYLQSAKHENTSEGYGTRRYSIKQLMYAHSIKQWYPLYNECIQTRLECSKMAYQINSHSWKNCGDYGEDLLGVERYEEAKHILEKGVEILQQSTELGRNDKENRLSFFHERINRCRKV